MIYFFQLKNINDAYIVWLKEENKKLFTIFFVYFHYINKSTRVSTNKRLEIILYVSVDTNANFPFTFLENTSTIESSLKCNQFC